MGIAQMKERFQRYDLDGSGDIGSKELVILLEELFPKMAHDPAMRPQLVKLMKEVDTDGSGNLDFRDFVQLMDRFRELQMQDQVDKEKRAVEETGFSPREVEEFRDLFLSTGQGAKELTFRDVQGLLRNICPLGDKNIAELSSHFAGVKSINHGKTNSLTRAYDEDGGRKVNMSTVVDFPEFLWLMQRLLDTNFAGIRQQIGG